MKINILTFLVLFLSTQAMSAEVGGIACPTEQGYRLFGYWPDNSRVAERLGSLSEKEVINLVSNPYSINGLNSITLRSDVDEFYFTTIKKYDYKFRLSDPELSHCEGVFLLTDTGEKWVSGYIFDQLAPFEKVAIYIEFVQKHLSFLRIASREVQIRRVGFYFTEEAQEKDMNQWMASYNAYLGAPDIMILLDYFQFDSSSLVFSSEDFRGILSDTDQIISVERSYVNVSQAQIIYKRFGVSEVVLPKPAIITALGGQIKSRHFTMRDKDKLHCAKNEEIAFVRDHLNKINIFKPGEDFCIENGYFYRPANIEDFQLSK